MLSSGFARPSGYHDRQLPFNNSGSDLGARVAWMRDGASMRNRMETLAEMKRRNVHLLVAPFGGGSLSLELAVMLGLSAAEIDQINVTYRMTKQRLSDQAIGAATSALSPDGTTLTVTVPPLPTNTDSSYSDLLNQVRQVRGPERFELFNELAGEQFDKEFDRFGLNAVTYQLSLQPTSNATGTAAYSYRYTSAAADAKETNWNSGTITRADIEENNPVLAHFLPAGVGTKSPTAH